MKLLEEKGYLFEQDLDFKEIIYIKNPFAIFNDEIFKKGYFTVQDKGSFMVSKILNPKENSRVLDICAAPGGKTCHMADIMKNSGKIIANDIYKERCKKIVENIERLGVKNTEVVNFDACNYKIEYFKNFDYILLDAPCSGSGIVKRKPEIKIKRTKEDVYEVVLLQRKIFDNAYRYLKNGGYIVYSLSLIHI